MTNRTLSITLTVCMAGTVVTTVCTVAGWTIVIVSRSCTVAMGVSPGRESSGLGGGGGGAMGVGRSNGFPTSEAGTTDTISVAGSVINVVHSVAGYSIVYVTGSVTVTGTFSTAGGGGGGGGGGSSYSAQQSGVTKKTIGTQHRRSSRFLRPFLAAAEATARCTLVSTALRSSRAESVALVAGAATGVGTIWGGRRSEPGTLSGKEPRPCRAVIADGGGIASQRERAGSSDYGFHSR